MSEQRFLSFLERPERGSKPRERGLTNVMPDLRSPTPKAVLEKHAEYVDLVKLLDTNLWAPAAVVADEIRTYQEFGIDVQVGGVPFELARLQDEQERYMDEMRELGISWIEYETHVGKRDIEAMAGEIERLEEAGFDVAGEVGSKWYWSDETRPQLDCIDVDRTIAAIEKYLEAGCETVYWEGLVVTNLIGKHLDNRDGQKALRAVVDAVGVENLVFEVWGPGLTGLEHARFWAWLVYQFGPEVNIGNVPPNGVALLESIRRGTFYEMDHPYLRWLEEDEPTEDWWRMPPPPYDVGLERDDG